MRHRIKKTKFKWGQDANKMLLRKLLINFFTRGKVETTLPKAKVLKSLIEKMANKAKEKTESNKNYLLKNIGRPEMVRMLFDQVGPVLKEKTGGYVRIIRLGQRISDGAEMARIEWVYPVVVTKPSSKVSSSSGSTSAQGGKEVKKVEHAETKTSAKK